MIIVNEDKSIYATRGDAVDFTVSANVDDERVSFQPGQIIRIKVYEKKNAENVVLQKDFTVTEECEEFAIRLTGADTKIGDVISKPVDYWYEIELNPLTNPQTIVGYDDEGAKIFKLLPEGGDCEDTETGDEDVDDSAITKLIAMLFPVGGVYASTNDTYPGELFGGVWGRIDDENTEVRVWKRIE